MVNVYGGTGGGGRTRVVRCAAASLASMRPMPAAPPPPAEVTKCCHMLLGGHDCPKTTAQKARPSPRPRRSACARRSALRLGAGSPSGSLSLRASPANPTSAGAPLPLCFRIASLRRSAFRPPPAPTPCSQFDAHCSRREMFALYLPNMCSLSKSLPNGAAAAGENTFPLSVSIWFCLSVFLKAAPRGHIHPEISVIMFFCTALGFFYTFPAFRTPG